MGIRRRSLDQRDVDGHQTPVYQIGNVRQENRGVVSHPPVNGFSGVVADKERVVAKIIFEFFIGVGSDPQGPYMDNFGIEKSLRVGFDKTNQGPNEVLRLATGGMDKDSVAPVYVAEDLLLGDKFLGIGPLHFITNSIRHWESHLNDSSFPPPCPDIDNFGICPH
jgi:hypothetical protein